MQPSTAADFPRPQPLDAVAAEVTTLHAPAVGLVTALVSAGVLGLSTGSILVAVLGLVPGALALAGTIIGARRVATKGAEQVTPLLSPMATNPDGKLVRLIAHGPPVD
jgi:hypothetical protein